MKPKTNKHDPILIIGLAIPFVMILIVAATSFIPELLVKPHTDFLYESSGDLFFSDSSSPYSIASGHLSLVPEAGSAPYNNVSAGQVQLYVWHAATNASSPITAGAASMLKLINNSTSPDGFSLNEGGQDDPGLFFFDDSSADDNSVFITGHGLNKKLNLQLNGQVASSDFHFLGWIQP